MRELLQPGSDSERQRREALRSRINVARAIGEARAERGLSQRELANISNATEGEISDLESLHGIVRFETLDAVARSLDLMIVLEPRREPSDAERWAAAKRGLDAVVAKFAYHLRPRP